NHISNLGTALAKEIAGLAGKDVPAFITDPTCVDEFEDVARLTGLPEIPRKSLIHALNQKAVARRYARENGKNYEEVNVIVPHMGSGITIGAHKKGRIIDNTNGLSEGPLTPERAGALPAVELVDLCFSGEHTKAEIMKKLYGKGGMMAYLGTNDVLEVQKRAKSGDEKAALVLDAMIYQTAKYIGAMGTVLKGEVDAIIITGSIAYNEEITNAVIERVKHIAPVVIYPGEDEMETLAMNGLMVLNGEIEETVYE
ncbi:MAG: butyrate kinase, partial [Marinilabiliales bacterium]